MDHLFITNSVCIRHADFSLESTIRVTCFLTCVLFTLLVNMLAFIALYNCKRMSDNIRIMTINLCVSDMLFSINLFILIIGSQLECTSCIIVSIQRLITSTLYFVSMFTVTAMVIDRTLSLVWCMQYYNIVTKGRVKCGSICIWLLASVLVFADFKMHSCVVYKETYNYRYLLVVPVCCVINIVCYSVTLRTIYKMHLKIKQMHISRVLQRNLYHNYRTVFKVTILTSVFLVCTLPYYIDYMLITFGVQYGQTIFTNIFSYLLASNSLINPFIYAGRFSECRIEMLKLVCSCSKSQKEKYNRKGKLVAATFLVQEQYHQSPLGRIHST